MSRDGHFDVSVLVPVYNGRQHLRNTVEALRAQTYPCFEMLFVDDGSTDGSFEYLSSISDERIRIIRQENRGLAHTLNRGIAECAGRYIARNDQDDISLPHRLERQRVYLEAHAEVDCLFSFYTKFGARGDWANTDKHFVDAAAADNARRFIPLTDGCQLGSTMMARKATLTALGGFRQEYYPSDDWDLELRMSESHEVRIIQEPLVRYHFHTGANTYRLFALMQHKVRWAVDSHHRRQAGLPERNFDTFLKETASAQSLTEKIDRDLRDRARLWMRLAGQHYLDGRRIRAALYFAGATALEPSNLVARIRTMKSRRSRQTAA